MTNQQITNTRPIYYFEKVNKESFRCARLMFLVPRRTLWRIQGFNLRLPHPYIAARRQLRLSITFVGKVLLSLLLHLSVNRTEVISIRCISHESVLQRCVSSSTTFKPILTIYLKLLIYLTFHHHHYFLILR